METIREFQLGLLKILIELDKILKENNLSYFLIGGSALGAVRHKGFIPWDDDIDIGLPRKDFEKMEKIIKNKLKNDIKYYEIGNKKIIAPPIGLITDWTGKNESLKYAHSIDIFPIDNVPNNKFSRKIQNIFSLIYHLTIYRKPAKNRGKKAYYFTKLVLGLFPNFLLDFLQSLSKRIITYGNKNKTKDICNLFGMKKYYKEIMPREYIGNPVLKEFEGYLFPIPEQWDKYLTHLYGDYMKLPPKELQKPSHKDFE